MYNKLIISYNGVNYTTETSQNEVAQTTNTFCKLTIIHHHHHGWWRGVVVSGVRCMNEVYARRARLVLGWVTVFGRVYHLGM